MQRGFMEACVVWLSSKIFYWYAAEELNKKDNAPGQSYSNITVEGQPLTGVEKE